MAKCDCGQTSSRIRGTLHSGVVTYVCPSCHPEEFVEPPPSPFESKVWRHEDAFPHLYRQRADGTLVAKDELTADTIAKMQGSPSDEALQQAIEKKRRTRRTKPLSQAEIEQAERWGRECAKKAGLTEST